MTDSLRTVRSKTTAPVVATPQSEKAAKGQKKNSAGGYGFVVTPIEQAKRFMILGSEKGYYKTGAELSKENADNLIKLTKTNSKEIVDLAVEISVAGRAPKQNPAIFALAVASSFGTAEERGYALSKLNDVCRTATTLFLFIEYALQFRKWGTAMTKAVARWYESKEIDALAYQTVKYQNREGWNHSRTLRITHPKGGTQFDALSRWILKGEVSKASPAIVQGFESAKTASSEKNLIDHINEYNLSWEMVPSDKRSAAVWEVLLKNGMPLGALIRQLPTLTRTGVLAPFSDAEKIVVDRLGDEKALKKARIHPISILLAAKVYEAGRNQFGKTWTPSRKVIDALDAAFYKAFTTVEPTGKRYLLALDVSGSMGSEIDGSGTLTSREATAAISLVLAATEPYTHTIGFTGGRNSYSYGSRRKVVPAGNTEYTSSVMELSISPKQRLTDAVREVEGLPFGDTDCSLPMLYALEKGIKVDTFIVMTDNETWAGKIHPFEALKLYREKTGIDARLIVLATEGSRNTIADPKDAGMLDIAGFDSSVPQLIAEFSKGL